MALTIPFVAKELTAFLCVVIGFESFTNVSEAPVLLAHFRALWTHDEPTSYYLFFPYNPFQDIIEDCNSFSRAVCHNVVHWLQVDTDTPKDNFSIVEANGFCDDGCDTQLVN